MIISATTITVVPWISTLVLHHLAREQCSTFQPQSLSSMFLLSFLLCHLRALPEDLLGFLCLLDAPSRLSSLT